MRMGAVRLVVMEAATASLSGDGRGEVEGMLMRVSILSLGRRKGSARGSKMGCHSFPAFSRVCCTRDTRKEDSPKKRPCKSSHPPLRHLSPAARSPL
jgi:hypothetical protein